MMRRFHKPGEEKRTPVIPDSDQVKGWLDAANEAQLRELLRPRDSALLTTAPGRLSLQYEQNE